MTTYRRYLFTLAILCFSFAGVLHSETLGDSREMPLPSIPDVLKTPEERAGWLIIHFWENADSQRIQKDSLFLEQNLANYFSIMPIADSLARAEGVRGMMARIGLQKETAERIAELGSVYLYEIESPTYDEESYLTFTDFFLNDSHGKDINIGEGARTRMAFERRQMLKNRIGSRASDFEFIDRDGNKRSLRDTLTPEAETLLIFYDVDCRDCHEYMHRLAIDPETRSLITDGRLLIIAIEANGADSSKWLADASRYPEEWIVGRSPNGEIDTEEIYALRRSPSIYRLDREGRVKSKI